MNDLTAPLWLLAIKYPYPVLTFCRMAPRNGEEPFVAKLHPEHAPYGDYDQLMRLDEWYGREG